MDEWLSTLTSMMGEWGPTGVQILKIIWINILLSGDNAVVIAMACRSLLPRQRIIGITLGAGAAVLLRVIFTVLLQYVMELAWLRLIGGFLLLYIAVKLLTQNEEAGEDTIKGSDNVWGAVKTVAIADMVMSLDNVLAIAGAAKGQPWLIVFGLVISIPLIVAGATLIMSLLTRFPILVWAGAALLGWIAGDLIMEDPISHPHLVAFGAPYGLSPHMIELILQAMGAATVLAIGWLILKTSSGEDKHAS
jgi:YjbE family integral membrane protein